MTRESEDVYQQAAELMGFGSVRLSPAELKRVMEAPFVTDPELKCQICQGLGEISDGYTLIECWADGCGAAEKLQDEDLQA